MHVIFLLEEESARVLIEQLAPKLLDEETSFECIHFRGKPNLLKNLPARLRGYASWLPDSHRLMVLMDRDNEDCTLLKKQLDDMAGKAGLISSSRARARRRPDRPIQMVNRIAIEEIEAWYFGDVAAMRAAYPRLPKSLGQGASYRDPDAIAGGTWEALERVLQKYGYHEGGLEKIKAARDIGCHMEPKRNVSRSFQRFCRGLGMLLAGSR